MVVYSVDVSSETSKPEMKRSTNTILLALLALVCAQVAIAQDPLPSWNDTAPKKAIIAFVERVTKEGSYETRLEKDLSRRGLNCNLRLRWTSSFTSKRYAIRCIS